MSDSSSATGNKLLDYAQLDTFAEIGFEEVRDIFDSMLEEAPSLLELLVASIHSGEATSGRAQAHSLRGMVLNFGCTGFAAGLASVERSADFPGGDPEAIVTELRSLWARSRQELEAWAASQSGSA